MKSGESNCSSMIRGVFLLQQKGVKGFSELVASLFVFPLILLAGFGLLGCQRGKHKAASTESYGYLAPEHNPSHGTRFQRYVVAVDVSLSMRGYFAASNSVGLLSCKRSAPAGGWTLTNSVHMSH